MSPGLSLRLVSKRRLQSIALAVLADFALVAMAPAPQ
jgi:hypothetical protein